MISFLSCHLQSRVQIFQNSYRNNFYVSDVCGCCEPDVSIYFGDK